MTAVLTLLTPVAAYFSIWALVAVRVAEGFFEVSQDVKVGCSHPNDSLCSFDLGSDISCNARYLGQVGTASREKYTRHYFLFR